MANWRPMQADDLPVVAKIAGEVHPRFFEESFVFAERQALAPQGCWICEGQGRPMGYVLAHPWTLAGPPALNSRLGGIPETPDTFYIHDLALLPLARGTGAARRIVETLIGVARDFPSMSLVAVNGSVDFWARFGFAVEDRPDLAQKLRTYDEDACFMVRASG